MIDHILYELLMILIKNRKWEGVNNYISSSKDLRLFMEHYLRSNKWNDVFMDRGKVQLERLAIACGFPNLRDKAKNFVQGKSKFIFRNVIFQLNHPRQITSFTILAEHGTLSIMWTSAEHGLNKYGCSVRYRTCYDKTIVNLEDMTHGLKFLSKLKDLPEALVQECHQMIAKLQEKNGVIAPREGALNYNRRSNIGLWSVKHDHDHHTIHAQTML
jgi:hypothetical protein